MEFKPQKYSVVAIIAILLIIACLPTREEGSIRFEFTNTTSEHRVHPQIAVVDAGGIKRDVPTNLEFSQALVNLGDFMPGKVPLTVSFQGKTQTIIVEVHRAETRIVKFDLTKEQLLLL